MGSEIPSFLTRVSDTLTSDGRTVTHQELPHLWKLLKSPAWRARWPTIPRQSVDGDGPQEPEIAVEKMRG